MAYSDVRNFYGGLSGVSDAVLGGHVTAGQLRVAADGVDASDSLYQTLVNLATGAYMQGAGLISGQLVEKSVADVRARYAGTEASDNPSRSLWAMYRMTLMMVTGMGDRVISGEELTGA